MECLRKTNIYYFLLEISFKWMDFRRPYSNLCSCTSVLPSTLSIICIYKKITSSFSKKKGHYTETPVWKFFLIALIDVHGNILGNWLQHYKFFFISREIIWVYVYNICDVIISIFNTFSAHSFNNFLESIVLEKSLYRFAVLCWWSCLLSY